LYTSVYIYIYIYINGASFTNLQRAERLVQSDGRDGADDDRFGVSTQGVLQDAGQLTVSVVGETPKREWWANVSAVLKLTFNQPGVNLREANAERS